MKKFLVVGGGTAGIVATSFLKKYYGPTANITILYDHKKPRIGVGESTTPFLWSYLNYLNIDRNQLLKHTNFTIKLGVKLKNWLGENDVYWNNFSEINYWSNDEDRYNLFYAYERYIGEKGLNNYQYSSFYTENNLIPNVDNYVHALHLDTAELSEYILEHHFGGVEIIDDVIEDVLIGEDGIEKIITKNKRELTADVYFDTSGFNKVLISKLNNNFTDLSKTFPLNHAIPFQVKKTKDHIESYTLTEATKNGWIWQTPLYNRYGTGYLYSDKFTSKEEAKDDFNTWLVENHGVELDTDRVINFTPGYYEDCWVKNCVAVGFASGFIEPLESTTIQIIINQMIMFTNIYSGKILSYDQKIFNKKHKNYFDNILNYILFHYHTRRTDSKFWRYMTSNLPEWVYDIEEKVKHSVLTHYNTDNRNFSYNEFGALCDGLNISTSEGAESYLRSSNLIQKSQLYFDELKSMKFANMELAIDHRKYLTNLKNLKNESLIV